MKDEELYDFLEAKYRQYNNENFIEHDPISIPKNFRLKQDIEISAFIIATISWGNRKSIIKNGLKLMQLMGYNPYDFVMDYGPKQARLLKQKAFVHRTFNSSDLHYFLTTLKHIYSKHHSLEEFFVQHLNQNDKNLKVAINQFSDTFCSYNCPARTSKHLARPLKNSAAKRINMFLRWMVRKDKAKIDFGIWKQISPAVLSIPLDVHSGRIARMLGLLQRKQNDWTAVEELDDKLRIFDSLDPVKYDYALFGIGAFEPDFIKK